MEAIPALVWIVMPVFVAGGAAMVTAALMRARMEVAVAREREVLAEARALLATQYRAMEERIRATEEASRREAPDEFMDDIHVEERQYVRESRSVFGSPRRLVLRERVCFRNIPLTGWIEHEIPLGTALLPTPEPPQREPAAAELPGRMNGRKLLQPATCP